MNVEKKEKEKPATPFLPSFLPSTPVSHPPIPSIHPSTYLAIQSPFSSLPPSQG